MSSIKNFEIIETFLGPKLLQNFSNRGCNRYKNIIPPMPNLIDGDSAILAWKLYL